jgi:hypothetical protein
MVRGCREHGLDQLDVSAELFDPGVGLREGAAAGELFEHDLGAFSGRL